MNWRELNIIQYRGATSKERVEARKLLDTERVRCYNHDRQFGTHLLLQFTLDYMKGFVMAEAEIDDGVPIPAENPASATPPKKRGRKPGTGNKPAENTALLNAVMFVDVVQTEAFEYSKFAALRNNSIVAYSNVLAAGYPIAEELNLCPQIDKLKAALTRCGKSLAITENNGQLSIKGDKLRAIVPCMAEALAPIIPDHPMLTGDFEILKEAFKVCGTVAHENNEKAMYCSVLLEPNTATATNGKVLIQHWHGIAGLPPGTVIPALFAKAVAGIKYKITGIGGNWNGSFLTSVTFWFENGAWLRTQCYEDRWQNFSQVIDVATDPQPCPEGLFDAVAAVEPFCEDSGAVYFMPEAVQSHREGEAGARYDVKGLVPGKVFHAKLIRQVAPYVETLDIMSYPDRGFFFGNAVRGVFMGMVGSQ